MISEEFAPLIARLDDLRDRAEGGSVGMGDFLSPKEAHYAEMYLRSVGARYLLWGGYEDAERRRVYVLPDYMEEADRAEALADYGFDCDVCAVLIHTDGYRKLSHRDYMGSVLGLGVDRAVVGDILVYGENGAEAAVFCTSAMRGFFVAELAKIAREKARVREIDPSEISLPERRFSAVSDTVASPRLDCVVGALCSLSREKARAAVVSGLVELDYECEERPDRTVSAPCLVSVRGYGKYRVLSVSDKTKKGRFRLSAEKYL
ncbi:MAG: hypothetical protein IJY08_06675 [Clostridia bacterium]|nr:hypothetical protein [Clostridia bacterium]